MKLDNISWPAAGVAIALIAGVVAVLLFAPEYTVHALLGGGGLLAGILTKFGVFGSGGNE